MEQLTNNFAARRAQTFAPTAILLLLILLLLTSWANAQPKSDSAQKALHERSPLDAALFAAYNKCDLDKVGTFFTEDLEFYYEKGGLTLTREGSLEIIEKEFMWRE